MSIDPTEFVRNDPFHKTSQAILGKRSIHSSESIDYYSKTLKADTYAMSILHHGLLFPFTSEPTHYEERNNRSALENHDLVWEKIKKWEESGYVVRVKEKPKCISPLSVAEKFDWINQSWKKRVCLDLSRHVNKFIPDTPVKLQDLKTSQCLLEPGDFQAAVDLENCFFHVRVNWAHQQ